MKAFISYAAEDASIAKDVFFSLKKYKLKVWLDIYEIKAGDNIRESIHNAIASSQILIPIITPNSLQSEWVSKELRQIIEEYSHSQIHIIPIVLEGTKVPPYLAEIRYIAIRPFDYHAQLNMELAPIIESALKKQFIFSSNQVLQDKDIIDLSKELAAEFPKKTPSAEHQTSSQELISPFNDEDLINYSYGEESFHIETVQAQFRSAAKQYKLKANITLGIMALLLGVGLYIFYTAGSLVRVESTSPNGAPIVPMDTFVSFKSNSLTK